MSKEQPRPASITIELPDPRDWARLVIGLRHAAEEDRKGDINPALPPGQPGAWLAVQYIFNFLRQQRAFMDAPDALAPVARLHSAITDLARGRVSLMFKPPSRNGDPGNSSGFEAVKGLAARALSELISAGIPKTEAARKVARACGELPEHGRVTSQNVIGWRKRLQERPGRGAPKHGAARVAYWHPLPAELGATPRERADSLLRELQTLAGRVV